MIRLNCDMGESFGIWKMGSDEEIIPHISMANLACGFHGSDPQIMDKSVVLAKRHNVIIGAHPGYQDLVGFGRRSIEHSFEEIKNIVLYQIGALHGFCVKHNTAITYVKPHGGLYHDMMNKEDVFTAIVESVASFNPKLKVMILSSKKNEEYEKIAKGYGVSLLYEAFADRNYTDDGFLVSRKEKNAVIKDIEEVKKRLEILKKEGYIFSENGKKLYLPVDALCVHGDTKGALEFITTLKEILDK